MSEGKRTPLYDLHVSLGARMVDFAGYAMPVQFDGVMPEHNQTRASAGLFDVSHMGQVTVTGGPSGPAAALETVTCQDYVGLAPGRQRYGLLMNDTGGLRDDLMAANRGDSFFVVLNAACKDADLAYLRAALPDVTFTEHTDRALLALQGPKAEGVLNAVVPVADMAFMDFRAFDSAYGPLWISRSGYSGEDGFEISVPEDQAEPLARALLADDAVAPVGLGARDSLRLEAGLCLYGSDLDETTSPIEAALTWSIGKARRAGGAREGGFPGAARVLAEMADGPARKRVGLLPEGRAPMRAGVMLFDEAGAEVGKVTSGGFGPSIGGPVAMGYVATEALDQPLFGEVRGKRLPVRIAAMPFRAAGYKR